MDRVIVLGSINEDLIAVCERHPERGETIRGLGLLRVPGGKGANQTLAAKNAGVDGVIIGAVGEDDVGERLLSYLRTRQIDVSHVRVDAVPTGTASIFVDLDGEISIVTFPGANEKVIDDLTVTLTSSDVCVSQLEVPLPSVVSFFTRGRQSGCTNILNASPPSAIPERLAGLTDICVVNERELSTLADVSMTELSTVDEITAVAQRIPFAVEGTVLVLLSNNDVLMVRNETSSMFESKHVQTVDSTGVEDCFIGYLAAMLVESSPIEEAIAYASRAAALASMRRGTAMPTRQEVAEDEIFEQLDA